MFNIFKKKKRLVTDAPTLQGQNVTDAQVCTINLNEDATADQLRKLVNMYHSSPYLSNLEYMSNNLKQGKKLHKIEQQAIEEFIKTYQMLYQSPLARALNEER